jgi:hypothetical protein
MSLEVPVIRDPLIRLMIFNWILGAFAGALCAAIVLISDIGRLRTLLSASDFMLPGLLLLFGGFMFTFAGVVCATALMTMQGTSKGPDEH